jgi:peptidyl-dipeptidase A
MRKLTLIAATAVGCIGGVRQEADTYLTEYAKTYQGLAYEAALADWESNTHIVEGDSTNAVRTRKAKEALARFVGSVENIDRIRGYLGQRRSLTPLQVRQLEVMLYNAADQPQTVAEVVARRIAAETEQVETLYGFDFKLAGKSISPNDIDAKLRESRNVWERRAVWEASKAVGVRLKPGMVAIRDLRNQTVRALGYPDYFSYQVSDYGMTTAEMLALTDTLIAQLRPLYRELHTWARYYLARHYRQPVPDLIPAHWLPNRWAQDWSDLITVAATDIDGALKDKTAEWTVRQGEAFYRSLGFDSLPPGFWERSSLYPAPSDAGWKKNTHASAWHLDIDTDVRSLMSVEPNAYWYGTVHHELGHVYYFMAYSQPGIPLILRGGANRAYHEGIGTMIELASSQRRYLVGRGLIAASAPSDSIGQLLKEALSYVVFMPFGAGTMTRFEHALYADTLPPGQFNARWWELAARYQGIAPPAARGEEYADGLTKTHITDDPAQYYDYALSQALLFQLHDHIARNILKQDPHDSDYFGSRGVGDFLRTLMAPGASRPWRDVLRETTGRALDARAMVEYFQPLHDWLVRENRGRKYTIN